MTTDNGMASAVADFAQQQQPKPKTMETAVADYATSAKDDLASQIRASAQQAVGVNPDKQSEMNETAKLLGMPPSATEQNMDVLNKRAAAQAIPAREITENTPHLANHLADPDKMKISSDDIATLDQVEKSLQEQHGTGMNILRGLKIGSLQTAEVWNHIGPAIGALLGADPLKMGELQHTTMQQTHTDEQPQGFWGGLAASIPAMAGGSVGMSVTAGEQKAQELEAQGVDPTTAALAGGAEGEVMGAATTVLPAAAAGRAGIAKLMGTIIDHLVKPAGVGAVQYAGGGAASNAILGQQGYTEQQQPITAQGAQEAAAQMLVFHHLMNVVPHGAAIFSKFAGQTAEAQKSLLEADQARSLSEAATASKLRARAPDTFHQFVSEASKDGPTENIYINPDTFKQAGINPEELAKLSASASEQLPAALASGADIKIPTSEFATYLAGSKVGDALLDHIKFDPEAFTKAEADEFFKTRDAQLQEDITRQLQKGENIATWQKSHDAVLEQIKAKMDASGKFPLQMERDINAKREAADYMVLAARLGITPEEAYAKYGSTLNVPKIGSDTFNQIMSPPVDANGNVTLHHWSRTPGLTKSDPSKWGQAKEFLTTGERNRIGDAPGRTYFGVAPGENGGYIKEKHIGEHHYEVSVPANRLYDAGLDPLALRDGVRAAFPEYMWGSGDAKSAYEKAIQNAGFAGYWGRDPSLGMAAAVFEPTHLRSTPEPAPETLINIGLKVGQHESITPEEAQQAVEKLGVKFLAKALHTSATEPTLVAKLSRPLTPTEAADLSAALKQEAIAQRVGGKGELYGPQADKWKPFNPDYFLGLGGNTFKQEDRPLLDAGFFSKMEDTLDKKLNATGTAKQYLDQIRAFAKSGAFKPDELKYSGLEKALEDEHTSKIDRMNATHDRIRTLEIDKDDTADSIKMYEDGRISVEPGVREDDIKNMRQVASRIEKSIEQEKQLLEKLRAEPDEQKITKQDVMDMLQSARERYALHEAVLESGGESDDEVPEIEFDGYHGAETPEIYHATINLGDGREMAVRIMGENGPAVNNGYEMNVDGKNYGRGYASVEAAIKDLHAHLKEKATGDEYEPGQKYLFDDPVHRVPAPTINAFTKHEYDYADHYHDKTGTGGMLPGKGKVDDDTAVHSYKYNIDGIEHYYRAVPEADGRYYIEFKNDGDGEWQELGQRPDADAAKQAIEDDAARERDYAQERFAEYWRDEHGDEGAGETQFMQYKMPGYFEDYKELVLHFPEINISGVSQHYRDFNTMAHIRFDTRHYEGKPVLFIEEIQADLHQQARNARAKKIESMMRNGNVSRENAEAAVPQDYGYANAHNADNGPITDVPFKKSYNELAMKRMLMWAVEHGQNRIAWTTGKQQVDRWSGALRQHVDRIRWEKTAEGIHIIGEQKIHGTDRHQERANTHYAETQLSDAIGKAMARKIIEDPNQTGIIEGDNIAIDDTGMSGVYDKVLPNVAKKVAGVEPEKIRMDFGNNTQEVHSIEITPEMKAKIKAEGFPLYQGSRGEYDPTSRTINLLNAKNFSTYLHEDAGHHFLNVYTQIALAPDAPLEIKADMDTVLRWFKVPGDTPEARLDAWHNMPIDEQRPMHEKWATATELYFMEGRAPSLELGQVFQKFRAWLLQIYKSTSDFLKANPAAGEINPSIRAVMDRMHATTDQITEAQDARFLAPMFSTPAEAGMTPDEFKAYHLEDVQGTQDAITALNARSMRDLALTRNLHSRALRNVEAQAMRWRKEVKAEVTEEVNNQPVNRARTFLKTGTVDGQPITEGAHRLDIDALKDMYGDGPDAPWRDLESKYGASGIMGKDGMHPDIAAEMFGFGSGDDLITALLNSENPKTQIDALTDQRMLQEHGDITNPQAMQEAADRAVHNEARTRSVATEMAALERMAGLKRTMKEAIKQHAEATVSTMAIRNIKPPQFMANETRAAKAADKARRAGDIVEAARQKRNQVIQNYATRSANKGLDDVEKALRYFKKFDRKSARKAVGLDAIAQIDNLLGQFDLSKHTTLKELDLRQWINHQESLGLRPDVDPRLLKASGLTSYKDMSLEAFRGLQDAVKSIEAIGRRETSIADGEKRKAFKEIINEAKDTLDKLPKISQPGERNPGAGGKGLDRINAKYLKLKEYVRSADASLLKMEQIGDWLDDRNSNGVFNRMLYRPIAKAVARQNEMKVEVGQLFKDLHNVTDQAFYKDFHNRYSIPELIDSRTGMPSQMLKSEILAMALNVRNDGNFNKMLKGEKWTKENVMAVLARHLTKTDIDFVNKYGDIAEYRYEDEVALNKRLGLESGPKVTGEDVELPNGTIKGGYYPLVYDPSRDPNVQDRAAKNADAMFEENTYSRPNTDTGRMNARVEGYAAPILLSLDALPRVTMDKIRNLALRETIIDADKFIRNRDVRKGINEALGPEYYAQFRPWLQSIANDRAFDPQAASFIERAAHAGRISATMVGLGYRLSTILKHGTTAASHSVGELGTKWAASGVRAVFGSHEKMVAAKDFCFDRSPFMAQRMANVERDFRDGLRDMDTKALTPAAVKIMPIYDDVRRFAMYGVAMSDMASCLPTWHGGYNKALSEGMSEDDAIYAADKAVRNAHGASGPQDLAQVMRGTELQKTLTMFYNFWNHFYNRQRDLGRGFSQARSASDFANLLAKSFFYIGATAAVHAYYNSPKQKDDDRKLFVRVGEEIAATMFDGIPIARDIANKMAEKGLGGLKDLNLEQSAVAPLTGTAKSANDIRLALQGKPDPKWVRNAINTAGYITGLPTGQLAQTGQFLWDVNHGHTHPVTGADWFNGIVHGRK